MKCCIASLLILSAAFCQAATLLSDFNNLTSLPYVTASPGPWSLATTQFTSTAATIADFGSGIPSGQAGNGFIYFLGGNQDWTSENYVLLTGFTPSSNATPRLNFYVEDEDGTNSILTTFTLSSFSAGNTSVALPINFDGVDRTRIQYWGFQVNETTSPQFSYSFDNVEISNVPEPSTAAFLTIGALSLFFIRRTKKLS